MLPKKVSSPFKQDQRPKLDITAELNVQEAAYYLSLISIIRWLVKLGMCRLDITTEASMMASFMAMPRQGNLDQLFHMFGFLKSHHNNDIVFHPSEPKIPVFVMTISEKYSLLTDSIVVSRDTLWLL